jgi:hypothetical protein
LIGHEFRVTSNDGDVVPKIVPQDAVQNRGKVGLIREIALDEFFFEFAFEQPCQVVSKPRFSLAKRVRTGMIRSKTDSSVRFVLSNKWDTEIGMLPAFFEGRVIAPALVRCIVECEWGVVFDGLTTV